MNKTTTAETSSDLARVAFFVATMSAGAYLRKNNLQATDEALEACIKSWIKAKMPEALHDAKEAFDCNMIEMGLATFKASISLAGIEAAKEAGFPQ